MAGVVASANMAQADRSDVFIVVPLSSSVSSLQGRSDSQAILPGAAKCQAVARPLATAKSKESVRNLLKVGQFAGGSSKRLHRAGPSARSLNRWIFPVAVFGRSSRNSIQRGYLN